MLGLRNSFKRLWVFFWFWPTLFFWYILHLLMYVHKNHRGRWFWYALLPLGAAFLVLDVAYNWLIGSITWLELPQEWTYTQRLIRKKREGVEGWQAPARILNKIDPNHV